MYKLQREGFGVTRLLDSISIPYDPANSDYQAYQAWVDAGGIPLAADPGPSDSQVAQQELDDLERTTLMNRGMREFLMVSMQDLAQRQSDQMADQNIVMSAADILNSQPAWVKLVAINEQAIALRKRIV